MIETPKTVNEKPVKNEIILKISDSACAARFEQLERKWMLTVVTFVLIATISGALIGVYIMSACKSSNHSIDDIDIEDNDTQIEIMSRLAWIAQPPTNEPLTKLNSPVTRIIIAHTGTSNCSNHASCAHQVRVIQTFHMESRGWDDIGYNFLVGGDGAVYVGRGWDIQGAHTRGYNANSICIAFIGTFSKVAPPHQQLFAAQRLIEKGVTLNKITSDYSLYGSRQLIPTESPGMALFEIIRKWDHWSQQT